jgi:hypothetical protein
MTRHRVLALLSFAAFLVCSCWIHDLTRVGDRASVRDLELVRGGGQGYEKGELLSCDEFNAGSSHLPPSACANINNDGEPCIDCPGASLEGYNLDTVKNPQGWHQSSPVGCNTGSAYLGRCDYLILDCDGSSGKTTCTNLSYIYQQPF